MNQFPSAESNTLTNLQVRLISSVILGVAVIFATWQGGILFRALAALCGLLVYWEWQSITGFDKYGLLELAAPASVAAAMVLVILDFPILESAIPAVFAFFFALAGSLRRGLANWLPFGVPYAIVPVLGITALRAHENNGLALVVFLFAIVWTTDIFAYAGGRIFGGPKLAPMISPNKTVSGAIAGSAAAVSAGIAMAAWCGAPGFGLAALLALALTAAAQAGDLFESHIKRRFGVKDSGTIIPGHGGVMDRVDGLIAATVALYAAVLALDYLHIPFLS